LTWAACPTGAVLRYIWRLLAGYRLPAGKHTGILTDFQTKVKKKTTKKALFWAALSISEESTPNHQ